MDIKSAIKANTGTPLGANTGNMTISPVTYRSNKKGDVMQLEQFKVDMMPSGGLSGQISFNGNLSKTMG